MRAAIYARYSSENQRRESIEDQISSCRKRAFQSGFSVSEEHVYYDEASSGARKDRPGLAALMNAAESGGFDVVLVDDLSRLARDNFLMLSLLAELRFDGVRVISVADGLDTHDEESNLGIQIRGIFNELQLSDLRKKTLRGQIGQKDRGFSVGERTYGYNSIPVGEVRVDKKGRLRPAGYKHVIDPTEAAVVLRIFENLADGWSRTSIVKMLNEERVPGRFCASKGWSPSTVSRILRNEKYIGKWIWNRTQTRRDPKTGRRRQFPKPESAWIVHHDENLRIVPQQLWDRVQQRLKDVSRTWPGGEGKRGFENQRGGRVQHYPTHLLSGAMICGVCGAAIGQVSGKSGGYYGCLAAPKHACENRLLVRRTLCEDKILKSIIEMLSSPVNMHQLVGQIEAAMAKQLGELPEALKLKEAALLAERRRVARFVEFIGDGRASKAVTKELDTAERRVEVLEAEIRDLKRRRDSIFELPSTEWIEERLRDLQHLLERRTHRSAIILRRLLGQIRLEPSEGDHGERYYRAVSRLSVLPLLERDCGAKDEDGSNTLRWRERRDSNSRPPA